LRDESHLDDMRATIRGDFERLEERRGEQVLFRPREQREVETPAIEPSPGDRDTPSLQQTVASDKVLEQRKRSWIERLLGL